ncbi:MAG TPA: DUF2281 domain-containing protein [Xanthomonadaceae bacterium]|nr:DUF2281 domain-containing protein [Xanthomonadaceae bacterium]
MNLPDTIYAHARALPADLQRETLDFISYLEQRYRITPSIPNRFSTEAFIEHFAGSIGNDFPDDIDDADLAVDITREPLE